VRRLLLYLGGVCAALALVEGAFRVFEREISASASRVETKAALLEKQGPVEVLFFGTSRFWDGIAPRRFAAAFPGLRAFSLAASGAKLPTLESEAGRFAGRPGLRLAVIELSAPQLDPGAPPDTPAGEVEGVAAGWLKLVAHRAALRGESLLRLPQLLLFARWMDGSEVRFVDQIASLLGRGQTDAPRLDLRPAPVEPSPSGPGPLASRLAAAGRRLRGAGAEVVFVMPPLLSCEPAEDVGPIAASLAREFPVWDYRAAALPRGAFRDCSHLDRSGRISFTQLLAVQAARDGLLHAHAGRLK
jgi:hypothetical protein